MYQIEDEKVLIIFISARSVMIYLTMLIVRNFKKGRRKMIISIHMQSVFQDYEFFKVKWMK
jgi:hypothetical protein